MDNIIITPRKDEPKPEPIVLNDIKFLIPECCREGWDSCKHSVRPTKPKKRNIAL